METLLYPLAGFSAPYQQHDYGPFPVDHLALHALSCMFSARSSKSQMLFRPQTGNGRRYALESLCHRTVLYAFKGGRVGGANFAAENFYGKGGFLSAGEPVGTFMPANKQSFSRMLYS